ncbi:MAG: PEP-CTERM sorting domain-containing protein [Terracidiphilus sp.]|jgi:hypothetical protein
MKKTLICVLAMAAALAIAPATLLADTITFNFTAVNSPATAVNTSTAGLLFSPVGAALRQLQVEDTNTLNIYSLSITGASVLVATGASSSYQTIGGNLFAEFTGGAGTEIKIVSPDCSGAGNICLAGTENFDTYYASPNNTGSLGGAGFTVTYVNPYIFSLFGIYNDAYIASSGSDSLVTSNNVLTKVGSNIVSSTGKLSGGNITFDTDPSIPEPSSLLLLGTGLLGLAGALYRKVKM